MLRLSRVTLREIRLPLKEPFRTANGVVDARRVVLAELTDADGAVAWSECVAESTPSYSPETVDTCWLALSEWIVQLVLGENFPGPQMVHRLLDQSIRGHRMARATIEMGMWSLEAQKNDASLAEALTRASAVSRTPRKFVDAGIAIGMFADTDALGERCRAAADEGYCRIKIKIKPEHDVAFAEAACTAAGGHAQVSVDANCSYSLDAQHVRALEELDNLGLSMIEQPLGYNDLLEHAELQRRLSTPICLDESITTFERTEEMLELASARVVNLKPGRVGGLSEAIAIHDRCATADVALWCGGMLETGIGRAYNVALASLPGFTMPGDLSPSSRYWDRDVIREPWTMDKQGRVKVPLDRPGIGVDVDESFVDDLTVRRTDFSSR